MNKICYGCGSKLQTENKEMPGYIPKSKINDASYCMRCFKLTHYGINVPNKTPKRLEEILYSVNKDNKHTILMVDFLSISDQIIKIYNQINTPKLLLVSKIDLINKDIKIENIRKYLIDKYQINNIKFISSNNGFGVEALLNYLEERNISSTYILGLSNSGKSTLINKLIDVTNTKMNKITTSSNKNTTLDFIRLNLNNGVTIIDSPGIIINSYNSELKENKIIKPITYQIKDNDTLIINDIYINFENKTNITIYSNYNLETKKYYKNDKKYTEELIVNDNNDLIIKGLGFINIKNKTNLKISGINKDILETRESIFR